MFGAAEPRLGIAGNAKTAGTVQRVREVYCLGDMLDNQGGEIDFTLPCLRRKGGSVT